ncbi:MAG: hypothetical protein KC516_00105 [Nanoarchaeota archaeon]|nr:hypothetical protein [Nanoarchaeota archaeon]
MIDKKVVLKELEERYEELKKEMGLSMSFQEMEDEFSIKDAILFDGFVGEKFSRQLCSKIAERFANWSNYLNGLIVPNSGFLPSSTESKIFSLEEDKKLIWNLIKNLMAFTSKNSLIVTKGDKEMEKEFLERSFLFWKNEFKPAASSIIKRVNEVWDGD